MGLDGASLCPKRTSRHPWKRFQSLSQSIVNARRSGVPLSTLKIKTKQNEVHTSFETPRSGAYLTPNPTLLFTHTPSAAPPFPSILPRKGSEDGEQWGGGDGGPSVLLQRGGWLVEGVRGSWDGAEFSSVAILTQVIVVQDVLFQDAKLSSPSRFLGY